MSQLNYTTNSNNIITLDIGGTIAKTMGGTLDKSTFFTDIKALNEGVYPPNIFVDIYFEEFQHIFNYMRCDKYIIPKQYLYLIPVFGITYPVINQEDYPITLICNDGPLVTTKGTLLKVPKIANYFSVNPYVVDINIDLQKCDVQRLINGLVIGIYDLIYANKKIMSYFSLVVDPTKRMEIFMYQAQVINSIFQTISTLMGYIRDSTGSDYEDVYQTVNTALVEALNAPPEIYIKKVATACFTLGKIADSNSSVASILRKYIDQIFSMIIHWDF